MDNPTTLRFGLGKGDIDDRYTQQMIGMYDTSMLTRKQKRVLAALVYIARTKKDSEGRFYTENTFLADVCGIDKKTLIKTLRVLEDHGAIQRSAGKRGVASTYSVNEELIEQGVLSKVKSVKSLVEKRHLLVEFQNSTHKKSTNKNSTNNLKNSTHNMKNNELTDRDLLVEILAELKRLNDNISALVENQNSTTNINIKEKENITGYIYNSSLLNGSKKKNKKEINTLLFTGAPVEEVTGEHAVDGGECPEPPITDGVDNFIPVEDDDLSAYEGDNEEKVKSIVIEYRNSSTQELVNLCRELKGIDASTASLSNLIDKLKKTLPTPAEEGEEEDAHTEDTTTTPVNENKHKSATTPVIDMVELEDGSVVPKGWQEDLDILSSVKTNSWPSVISGATVFSLARYVHAPMFFDTPAEREKKVQELIDTFKPKVHQFLSTIEDRDKRDRLKHSISCKMISRRPKEEVVTAEVST